MNKAWLFLLAAVFGAAAVLAADPPPAKPSADARADVRAELAKKMPGVKVGDLSLTPIPGIYELRQGTEIGYISSDGRYFFSGELHDLKTQANLTESRRGDGRRKLLARVSEKEMVVFGPENAPYTITVFTDVDCGYCRQLHSDVPELNKLGIRVRYLFYPRAGPGSESWQTAESIWCSADRKDALTRAKRGESIQTKNCANPVARQYELGQSLGIRGTPGIFTGAGAYLPGYLPPQIMLARLQKPGNT